MKKILVTGAAGFLGSHLCENLQNLNYHVIGVDSMIGGDLDNLPKNLEFLIYFETVKFRITGWIDS